MYLLYPYVIRTHTIRTKVWGRWTSHLNYFFRFSSFQNNEHQWVSMVWEGWDFGMCLWEFAPIQSNQCLWGRALMLDEKARLAIAAPCNPEVALWALGQGSVQVIGVPPHQTYQTHVFMVLVLCTGQSMHSCWYKKAHTPNCCSKHFNFTPENTFHCSRAKMPQLHILERWLK